VSRHSITDSFSIVISTRFSSSRRDADLERLRPHLPLIREHAKIIHRNDLVVDDEAGFEGGSASINVGDEQPPFVRA